MKYFASLLFAVVATFQIHAGAQQMTASFVMNPVGDFKAKTSAIKGSATQQGDTVHAENIVIDVSTLATGLDLRDKHAKEKYLEMAKYPQIVLVKADGKGGKGQGILKLHGVEHPVSGTYVVKGNMLTADFTIKLSDFKIAEINYKGVGVEDEAKISVTVPLTAAAAPAAAAAKKTK